MTILDQLAQYARVRVERDRMQVPVEQLQKQAAACRRPHHAFYHALRREGLRFICEVKKGSPSKGIISEDFPYLSIAKEYEAAGADAVSCLTEPGWFLGSDAVFRDIRAAVDLPMIRKDFTVDEYQIWQARAMGADAVLLICAILEEETIAAYLELCGKLGMDALVEAHDEEEITMAVRAGARIIGVNNRNLKDFSVDFSNAERLRGLIPPEVLYVAESGVKNPGDVAALRKIGADAVLMGEVLMRADNKTEMISAFREAARRVPERNPGGMPLRKNLL